jgi:hypothetical protein
MARGAYRECGFFVFLGKNKNGNPKKRGQKP